MSTAASRGTAALVLHQARYDLLGFIRNRQARFFTLVLPLLFLVIFVSVFGNDKVGPGTCRRASITCPASRRWPSSRPRS